MPGDIRSMIDGEPGWCVPFSLTEAELARVRELIAGQWLRRIESVAKEAAPLFASGGLREYHRNAHRIDHAALWPKAARMFPPAAIAELRTMSLFRQLEDAFGAVMISDEENYGQEEIYWRLVRPHSPGDIGPLHADSWFWKLGNWAAPPGFRRVKLWVAVECEPGLSGLNVLSGSHRREFRYHGVFRDGKWKPQPDDDLSLQPVELVATRPGDAIVFHDDLLHGGALNRAETTRVSFECTLFVRE